MGLEGALRVGLRVSQGRVAAVRIDSTRPDLARRLLQGRSRAELVTALPLLFSICGRSQAAAGQLACAAAAGEVLSPETMASLGAGVAAEMLREDAWRILLDWPGWIGEAPDPLAVAAARGSLAIGRLSSVDPQAQAIATAAFGMPAVEWLAADTPKALDTWLARGQTAAARFIRQVRDDDAARLALGASATGETGLGGDPVDHARNDPALLPSAPDATLLAAIAQAMTTDPDFASHPLWQDRPAETGALARWQHQPLIAALSRRSAGRMLPRYVARLLELAQLLAGRVGDAAVPTVGALTLPDGGGIGWVVNARGLLVHHARLDGDRVTHYRIVAPTEWNFHPAGALVSALMGSPAHDLTSVKQQAARWVHSLDPCVACRVEIDDA